MELEPIASESLRDQVAAALRQSILRGDVRAGDRLTEPELARQLRTSRGPVREALRDLEQEGLVKSSAHRSVHVLELRAEEVDEVLLPIRLTIEEFAFRRARALLTAEDFATLEELTQQMEAAAKEGLTQRLVDLDVAFHEHVVRVGGQDQGRIIWRSIQPRLRASFLREHQARYGAGIDVAGEHRVLLDVLRESTDSDQVTAALREHVEQHRE